jgi:hypothetical protein
MRRRPCRRMPRWAWGGFAWLVGACAQPSTIPRTAEPAQEPEVEAPRSRLLQSYDEAGFPDVGGRRLVERRIELPQRVASCARGVLLQRGHVHVFLSANLWIDYGTTLVDAIPHAMRGSTPREPRFVSSPIEPPDPPVPRVVDIPLPDNVLALPALGLPGEGACDAPDVSPDLDIIVRARWAEMRGRPDLVDPTLADIVEDAELEDDVRAELAAMLHEQALAGLREWLPRMEVAQLLRRAARLTPSREHERMWLLEAHRLDASTRLQAGDTPEAIATLLAEQSMDPLHELDIDVRGANWDVTAYLRDPVGELIALGMPGAERLVAHADDETWTRARCDDQPCTVGEVVRKGLALFAGRPFASAAEVHAWWAEVEGMTQADMARASFGGPSFPDAAMRLVEIEGPSVVDELAAELRRHDPDEVGTALYDALRLNEDRVLEDRDLRARYARALSRVADAAKGGWAPSALRGLLDVDPDAALARFVPLFDRALPERGDAAPRIWSVWTVAFITAMKRSHAPMRARLLRALALPRGHALRSSALKAVDHACPHDCPPAVSKAAIRALRRAGEHDDPRHEKADRATLAALTLAPG